MIGEVVLISMIVEGLREGRLRRDLEEEATASKPGTPAPAGLAQWLECEPWAEGSGFDCSQGRVRRL